MLWLAFRDALHGPPTSWVCPGIPPSQNPSSIENGLFSPSSTSSLLFCWNGIDHHGSSDHLVDSCTSKIPVSTKRRGVRMQRCQWDGKNEGRENEPQCSSWFIVGTYWMGLPHPGSPLLLPSPQILRRVSLSSPHPGGADAADPYF